MMRKYDINIFISVIPRNDTTLTLKLKSKKLDVKDHIPLQEIVKKKKKMKIYPTPDMLLFNSVSNRVQPVQ